MVEFGGFCCLEGGDIDVSRALYLPNPVTTSFKMSHSPPEVIGILVPLLLNGLA